MVTRRKTSAVVWLVLLASVLAEESPPGLVSKDSDQDLLAQATHTGPQAQKREASLSNSYGEPLPPDAYGPPSIIPNVPNTISDIPASLPGAEPIFESNFPSQDFQNSGQEVPHGAYGPPRPLVFPSVNYDGPPPPVKPKPVYGPPKYHAPKPIYGPPKQVYGPPKKGFSQKQNLPKPNYGAPFKPPKLSFPKPIYGVPKQNFGPKPVYGPPKISLGGPINVQNIPLPELSQNVGNNIDFGNNLPAPIYGTPLPNLPLELKPSFPIPSDSYGPPGHDLGPIGPNDQLVVQDLGNIHYGPPQPDPNPKPPHPGIPAPPTPPHVLYDGWKPIPGVSKPILEVDQHIDDQFGPPPPPPQIQDLHLSDGHSLPNANPPRFNHNFNVHQDSSNFNVHQDNSNFNAHQDNSHFNAHQDNSNFNAHQDNSHFNVHQDALANLDLNSIIGGDSNHIDQSKTVFEAHYTDNNQHGQQQQVTVIHGVPSGPSLPSGPSIPNFQPFPTGQALPTIQAKPFDTYGTPLDQGPYPSSIRQFGAKGLAPPSGQYGVPPGSQYGAPPRPPPNNLPIPFGAHTGGGHNGFNAPRHPIKFRDSVPDGLIQQIVQTTHHKDHHGIDQFKQGPTYLPPPIRETKDINQQTSNHGNGQASFQSNGKASFQGNGQASFQGNGQASFHGNGNNNGLSLSIEPSNLYSLPHGGNPINFQAEQPSTSYGSPIDSYSVPLLTVGDHTALGSNTNAVTATLDGTILANLSNLDAAAILKHCPYHEAILKAAKSGEKIPSDLASSYVASLSSLGTTLSKNQLNQLNGFKSESGSYNSKDLASASHTVVQAILPEKNQKGKALRDASGKLSHGYKQQDRLQSVSQQILQTSQKIKNLSEEAKQLQQKINSANLNINQNAQFNNIPVRTNAGGYSVEIQSSDGKNKNPSIPHDQLLSEGLLQSILQAIEQPASQKSNPNQDIQSQGNIQSQASIPIQVTVPSQSNIASQASQTSLPSQASRIKSNQNMNYAQSALDFTNIDQDGLVLPAGYEPIDRSKQKQEKPQDLEVQNTNKNTKQILHRQVIHKHRGDIPQTECDLRADNSITHTIVIPPPSVENVKPVHEVEDNDVAIFFGDKDSDKNEPVTEISVATSISEDVERYGKRPEFGDKIKS